jgi:pimeloyl-ACP methyl ester carboxylesterase
MHATRSGSALPFVVENGQGEPVVLLHGSAADGSSLAALAGLLDRRYRVIRPDLFGYGESPHLGHREPPTMDALLAVVEAAVRRAGGPVHLAGHSMGGAIALHAALRHPAWVRSLALIEPVAFHLLGHGDPADRRLLGEIEALYARMVPLTMAGRTAEAMSAFVDYWNGARVWGRLAPRTRVLLARQAHLIVADFEAVLSNTSSPDAYRQIHIPTLVVAGTTSRAPARRVAELVHDTIPESRLAWIEGGHMLPETHPVSLARQLAHHFAASIPAGVQPHAA